MAILLFFSSSFSSRIAILSRGKIKVMETQTKCIPCYVNKSGKYPTTESFLMQSECSLFFNSITKGGWNKRNIRDRWECVGLCLMDWLFVRNHPVREWRLSYRYPDHRSSPHWTTKGGCGLCRGRPSSSTASAPAAAASAGQKSGQQEHLSLASASTGPQQYSTLLRRPRMGTWR